MPYQSDTVQSSLFRNGKVLTRRNVAGSDNNMEGLHIDLRPIRVWNGRIASPALTLEVNGFQLCQRPSPSEAASGESTDFYDNRWVLERYYPDCARVLKEATGAARVIPFDHNVRSASGKANGTKLQGGNAVQGPALLVHGDYTLTSAPQRIRDLAEPPKINDTLRPLLGADRSALPPKHIESLLSNAGVASGSRWAIINVWRNIRPEPVQSIPLAMCDGQSVSPADLVVFEIHYGDRIGENYLSKHNPRHKWHYFPHLARDEVLLLKQWDSAGGLARFGGAQGDAHTGTSTFSFHSAFMDPTTPDDAPDRESIEVRCIVLYDEPAEEVPGITASKL